MAPGLPEEHGPLAKRGGHGFGEGQRSGWDMAERITPLMGVRWEDGLDRPLDVWRRELNVEPIREGPSSWYTVLSDLRL